jgi:quercetin dioxygenase-like cupin family protein
LTRPSDRGNNIGVRSSPFAPPFGLATSRKEIPPMPGFSSPARRLAVLLTAGAIGVLLLHATAVCAAASPISRTDLQRHDLDIPGHEAVQVRVDFAPGATAPRHKHPGEEIIYVLKGVLEYRLEGRPPATLKAGDVLFVPTGTVHEVKNVGPGEASELATYVVEKGKPLVVPVK